VVEVQRLTQPLPADGKRLSDQIVRIDLVGPFDQRLQATLDDVGFFAGKRVIDAGQRQPWLERFHKQPSLANPKRASSRRACRLQSPTQSAGIRHGIASAEQAQANFERRRA